MGDDTPTTLNLRMTVAMKEAATAAAAADNRTCSGWIRHLIAQALKENDQ